MKQIKIWTLAIAALYATACSKSSEDAASSSASTGSAVCSSTQTLTGDISSNTTIAANSCIAISGMVRVLDGVTLTINKGTTVLASTSTLSYILVKRGGKLIAIGDASNPIVFTSAASVGSRSPSDWGGIVLHGKSGVNNTTGVYFGADTEISTGAYGCGDTGYTCSGDAYGTNDNSGSLQYVRIEFAGRAISSGKEFNGLFMAGVGKGTTVDHVQFHRGSDDGTELFGGAVDVKYAVITNNQDDGFDLDEGWRGTGSFIVSAVYNDGDKAIEYDGLGADTARASNAVISNMTMLGSVNKTAGAISIRASGTVSIYNSYIAHFWGTNGVIAVDSSSTTNATATPNPTAAYGTAFNLIFASNKTECMYSDATLTTAKSTIDSLFCTGTEANGTCTASTLAASFPDGNTNNDISNWGCTSPKIARPAANVIWGETSGISEFKPAAAITVTTHSDPQAAPNGTDLTQPTYVGAFSGPTDSWADGWTSFPKN